MIVGLTRIRNEQEIIGDTLDHFSQWCDQIIVLDDASNDLTNAICGIHPNVSNILKMSEWNPDRTKMEYVHRQMLLDEGFKLRPDWFIYFDADERIEMPENYEDYDAVRMKLFDFYITQEDVDKSYGERKWMGPEYREIIMMFRNDPRLKYWARDQREVTIPTSFKVLNDGFVKHYGKAISIDEWEKTCDYYSTYFPAQYRQKWLDRKGKAIHTQSDFGRKLITWDQKEIKGVKL